MKSGGTLFFRALKELGKTIVFLALGEAEIAALAVLTGGLLVLPFLLRMLGATGFATVLPLALLMGALATPTDPSATLAVMHQYRARGMVSFSIMGAAAFDDALAIINFSVASVVAILLATRSATSFFSFFQPFIVILSSLALGVGIGFIYHGIGKLLGRAEDGIQIALIVVVLLLGFGLGTTLKLDALLVTMTSGMTVVNVRRMRPRIFQILERSVEPLVFLLFFTLSGL